MPRPWPGPIDGAAVDPDRTVIGWDQPIHDAKERRLAAAAWSHDGDELEIGNRKRYVLQHRHDFAASPREPFGQVADLELRLRHANIT